MFSFHSGQRQALGLHEHHLVDAGLGVEGFGEGEGQRHAHQGDDDAEGEGEALAEAQRGEHGGSGSRSCFEPDFGVPPTRLSK